MPLEKFSFPFLHPNIYPIDLKPNRKLLSSECIKNIKARLADKPDGRYRKEIFMPFEMPSHSRYGIIKFEGRHFAIYKGLKKNAHIAANNKATSKVKLVQDLDTGDWCVMKVMVGFSPESIYLEYKNLKERNLLVVDHVFTRASKQFQSKEFFLIKLQPGLDLVSFLSLEYNSTLNPLQRIEMVLAMLKNIKKYHDQNFLLCDLKPDNFIYNEETKEISFVDLASLRKMDESGKVIYQELHGTPNYLAPELLKTFAAAHLSPDLFDSYLDSKVDPSLKILQVTNRHKDFSEKISKPETLGALKRLYQYYAKNRHLYNIAQTQIAKVNKPLTYTYNLRTEMFSVGNAIKVLLGIPILDIDIVGTKDTKHIVVKEKPYQLGDSKEFHAAQASDSKKVVAKEKDVYKAVIDFVNQLTSAKSEARPKLDKAIEFFEDQRNEFFKEEQKDLIHISRINVGVIYLEDMHYVLELWKENKNDKDYIDHFVGCVSLMDELQIVTRYKLGETNPLTNHILRYSDLVRLQRILISQVRYRRDIYVCPTSESLSMLPDYLNLNDKEPNSVKKTYVHIDLSKYTSGPLNILTRNLGKLKKLAKGKKRGLAREKLLRSNTDVESPIDASYAYPVTSNGFHKDEDSSLAMTVNHLKINTSDQNGTDKHENALGLDSHSNGYHESKFDTSQGPCANGVTVTLEQFKAPSARETPRALKHMQKPASMDDIRDNEPLSSPLSSPPLSSPATSAASKFETDTKALLSNGVNIVKVNVIKSSKKYRDEVGECKSLVSKDDFLNIIKSLKTERNRLTRVYDLDHSDALKRASRNNEIACSLQQFYTLDKALGNFRYLQHEQQLSYSLAISLLGLMNKQWHKDAPPPNFFRKIFPCNSPFEDLRKNIEAARLKL